jgi:hypothetical protein
VCSKSYLKKSRLYHTQLDDAVREAAVLDEHCRTGS